MDHVALSCSVFVFVMNRRDGRKNRGSIMLSIILFSICWLVVVVGANNSFTRQKTRRKPDPRPDLFRNSREDKEDQQQEEGIYLSHHFETRKRLIFCIHRNLASNHRRVITMWMAESKQQPIDQIIWWPRHISKLRNIHILDLIKIFHSVQESLLKQYRIAKRKKGDWGDWWPLAYTLMHRVRLFWDMPTFFIF